MKKEQDLKDKTLLDILRREGLDERLVEESFIRDFHGLVELKLRYEHFMLRKKWAYLLGGINVGVIVFVFIILFLAGLGCLKFPEYVLGILIGMVALDNALNRHVTKYLFSDKVLFQRAK